MRILRLNQRDLTNFVEQKLYFLSIFIAFIWAWCHCAWNYVAFVCILGNYDRSTQLIYNTLKFLKSHLCYHFESSCSFIWVVNHSIPSWRPSPVTELLWQMCHGLSIIRCNPRSWDTLTLDIVSLESILFARNKIGISRDLIWGF